MFHDGFYKADTHMHPNLLRYPEGAKNFIESDFHVEKHFPLIRQIFETMEENGVALELNAFAIRKAIDQNGPHPEDVILKLSKEYQLTHVYGSDAHAAQDVGTDWDRTWQAVRAGE